MSDGGPTPEELQRELDTVRAASPTPAPTQPSVRKLLMKSGGRVLMLWALLIVMFLATYVALSASK